MPIGAFCAFLGSVRLVRYFTDFLGHVQNGKFFCSLFSLVRAVDKTALTSEENQTGVQEDSGRDFQNQEIDIRPVLRVKARKVNTGEKTVRTSVMVGVGKVRGSYRKLSPPFHTGAYSNRI